MRPRWIRLHLDGSPPLGFGLWKFVLSKQLPWFDFECVGNSLHRFEAYPWASMVFNVLKVTRTQSSLLGNRFLSPTAFEPSSADVFTEDRGNRHLKRVSICLFSKHATMLA